MFSSYYNTSIGLFSVSEQCSPSLSPQFDCLIVKDDESTAPFISFTVNEHKTIQCDDKWKEESY